MRALSVVALGVLAFSCSNGRSDGGDDDRDRERPARDGGAKAASPAHDSGSKNAGGGGASVTWSGTFRGETEVPDGGLPDGGAAWHGEGTVQLLVGDDEEVTGALEAEGTKLEVHGNIHRAMVNAWLRAPPGQPRTEGVLLGQAEGARITGTWRTSGPGGAEVRAGTFEARR